MASAVIDKQQYGKRDTLAMPILYNARHAVELSLKFAIGRLCETGMIANAPRRTTTLSPIGQSSLPPHWAMRTCVSTSLILSRS